LKRHRFSLRRIASKFSIKNQNSVTEEIKQEFSAKIRRLIDIGKYEKEFILNFDETPLSRD